MGALLKAFGIFWIIWLLWYVTGGPLRDDKTHPYVRITDDGKLMPASTSTIKR